MYLNKTNFLAKKSILMFAMFCILVSAVEGAQASKRTTSSRGYDSIIIKPSNPGVKSAITKKTRTVKQTQSNESLTKKAKQEILKFLSDEPKSSKLVKEHVYGLLGIKECTVAICLSQLVGTSQVSKFGTYRNYTYKTSNQIPENSGFESPSTLSPLEQAVLSFIAQEGSVNRAELRSHFRKKGKYKPKSAQTILYNLEKRGLVSRDRNGTSFEVKNQSETEVTEAFNSALDPLLSSTVPSANSTVTSAVEPETVQPRLWKDDPGWEDKAGMELREVLTSGTNYDLFYLGP